MTQRIKLTPEEVEAKYNINKGTLANWRSQRKGPKYSKVGRRVLYDVSVLEAFFQSKEIQTA